MYGHEDRQQPELNPRGAPAPTQIRFQTEIMTHINGTLLPPIGKINPHFLLAVETLRNER